MHKIPISVLFVALIALSLVACKKKETTNTNDSGTNSASNFAAADNLFGDAFKVVNQAAIQKEIDQAGKTTDTNDLCATLTLTPANNTVFPKTLTIDFGNGCLGSDGRFRKGIVTAVFSDFLLAANATITCSFNNYFVDNYQVEGTYSIQNLSTANAPKFGSVVTNGKITDPTGKTFMWSESRTSTMTAGMGDFNYLNDEYDIEGSGNGTNVEGVDFSMTTNTPLHVKTTCKWVTSGLLTITTTDIIPISATIDYGNGNCDNQATATIGTYSAPITLP